MQVPSVTSTTNSTGQTSATDTSQAGPTIDYNMFLQLLIAEMKNQDPTSPTDTTEYMSQFAQFSSVEQAVQTNSKLDTLLTSNALSQADGLIGRTASFTSTDGDAVSGKIVSISILSGGVAVATLEDGSSVQVEAGVTIS
jgi:flagellar basal-body rod modification protein FlgD